MTGGSAKQNQSSLLGRKREKEELDAKKTKLEEAIRDLEKQVKQDKERRQELQETIAKVEAQKRKRKKRLKRLNVLTRKQALPMNVLGRK